MAAGKTDDKKGLLPEWGTDMTEPNVALCNKQRDCREGRQICGRRCRIVGVVTICLALVWGVGLLFLGCSLQRWVEEFRSQQRKQFQWALGIGVDLQKPGGREMLARRAYENVYIMQEMSRGVAEISALHRRIAENSGTVTTAGAYILAFRAPSEAARLASAKGYLVALTPGLVQWLVLLIGGGALLFEGIIRDNSGDTML